MMEELTKVSGKDPVDVWLLGNRKSRKSLSPNQPAPIFCENKIKNRGLFFFNRFKITLFIAALNFIIFCLD